METTRKTSIGINDIIQKITDDHGLIIILFLDYSYRTRRLVVNKLE